MKIKQLLAIAVTVAFSETAYAQYAEDALRFSTSGQGSTSRAKALGNAFTAVGGDLTSVSSNPAGLGFFTKSEFSLTPEFNGSNVKSTFFNNNLTDSKDNINLNNVAAVFYSRLNSPQGADKTKGWLSLNFGIGYNRTNNFYENSNYSGINPNNSIADYYAELGNNFSLEEGSLQQWAYDQNLIDQYNSGLYEPNTFLNATQSSHTIRSGGQSEISLAMGTNYSNQLYLGLGVGISNIRYNSTSTFTEEGTASILDANSNAVDRDYISDFATDQITKGTGINARLGLIYKPVEAVRIGATFTTPTWYTIDDSYSEGLNTSFIGGDRFRSGPVYYDYTYNLRTPAKVNGGMAVFIQQYGFLSADVEFIDYTNMKLSSDGVPLSDDNKKVLQNYKSAVNYRLGAEAKLDQFFLRGGFGIQGNPYKNLNNSDFQTQTISGGVGYRVNNYYVDLTYNNVSTNSRALPYLLDGGDAPEASFKKKNDNVFLTFGVRF
jgi:hypothetical protein